MAVMADQTKVANKFCITKLLGASALGGKFIHHPAVH
jgi:hypothetical protein